MTYDPNMNSGRPDLQSPRPPNRGNWLWAALGAVVVLGVVLWVSMGGPATDPTTTSSTTQPAATETAPAIEPMDPAAPATPPAGDVAPATPDAGTAQP
ncbi:hypothetical protein ACQQ2Q_07395 [Agrobacterium sp. ES01]|uniref:hypothetical protein n=1 Tax=Agrobacterium sp. ES01 TaxID=3420714 RepID=UPI003D147124